MRAGGCPSIQQQSTAQHVVVFFPNAQVIAGLNTLRINACRGRYSWGNAEEYSNVKADFFCPLSAPWAVQFGVIPYMPVLLWHQHISLFILCNFIFNLCSLKSRDGVTSSGGSHPSDFCILYI